MADRPVPIPRDPEARRRLANFAGLTDEERHAIDAWCFEEEAKRARGVALYDGEPREHSDSRAAMSDVRCPNCSQHEYIAELQALIRDIAADNSPHDGQATAVAVVERWEARASGPSDSQASS